MNTENTAGSLNPSFSANETGAGSPLPEKAVGTGFVFLHGRVLEFNRYEVFFDVFAHYTSLTIWQPYPL
nr:hypothetical protein [Bacillus siamensis]